MLELIQLIVSISALSLSFLYLTGGLIVNLNLSRHGLTEYQILRVKYLVVGLVFCLNSIGNLILSIIVSLFLLWIGVSIEIIAIISFIASGTLLFLWARAGTRKNPWLKYVVLATSSYLFPFVIFLQQLVRSNTSVYAIVFIALAFLLLVLSYVGQTYYYATNLYGRQTWDIWAKDPIGKGSSIWIQIAGKNEDVNLLAKLGLTKLDEGLTDMIELVDETNSHYIVLIEGQHDGTRQAVKISKDMVKAIMYFDTYQANAQSRVSSQVRVRQMISQTEPSTQSDNIE